METLFALVMTVGLTNGDFQDVVVGIYESQQQCEAAAVEQLFMGECYPVERIVHTDKQLAGNVVKF